MSEDNKPKRAKRSVRFAVADNDDDDDDTTGMEGQVEEHSGVQNGEGEQGQEEEEELPEWVVWSDQVMHIHLVHNPKKKEEVVSYDPEFTHQIIGPTEKIFGYGGLSVDISYTCGSLKPFAELTFDECVSDEDEFAQPDDIVAKIREWMPPDFTTDKAAFETVAAQDYEAFTPVGECIVDNAEINGSHFSIFKATVETDGFKEFHQRAQTLPVWSIEQGSWIDVDDPDWVVFYMFRHKANRTCYEFVALTTVYKYFSYPDKKRMRISQHLVLPPFQGQGFGSRLLREVESSLCKDPLIKDITTESPSEGFTAIRDRVDCKRALEIPEVKAFKFGVGPVSEFESILNDTFKLCKRQCRRVYEILFMGAVINGKASQETFEQSVKNRMCQAFYVGLQQSAKREQTVKNKLKAAMEPSERKAVDRKSQEERYKLREQFAALQESYAKVILSIANVEY